MFGLVKRVKTSFYECDVHFADTDVDATRMPGIIFHDYLPHYSQITVAFTWLEG